VIKNIAVLLTCHNRKEKTISCLKSLFNIAEKCLPFQRMDVYLTDDGCTDGTGEAVAASFPTVKILKGNGNLFWAGGMRCSWNEALKYDYDAYLLLNDDTNISYNLFEELKICHEYSIMKYNCSGIYIGSTHDGENNVTYGGSVIKSKFLNTYRHLVPDGKIEECDLGNGNIMMVTRDVVKKIGIFSEDYTHSIADYDYTLTARKNNIPVLVTANYCGICSNDNPYYYSIFINLAFTDRKKYLYHPAGLAFYDQIKFMKKFYPYRLPFIYAAAWFKLVFPKIYFEIDQYRRIPAKMIKHK
jgi:GT2 family glycosyltransferase